jgi:hypothetical protein
MEAILTFLAQWLSSGPIGIILGIIGLGGIGVVIARFTKKVNAAKLDKAITDSAATAGSESASLSDNMRANTQAIDAAIAGEIKRQTVPGLFVPHTAKKGMTFTITTVNIPPSTPILADKKWTVGYTTTTGTATLIFNTAGKRTIDILVGETWKSGTIVITEE